MASLLDFLRRMPATMPGTPGHYRGLGGTGGIAGGGYYPPWATPPFNPNASVPFPQPRTATRGVPLGGSNSWPPAQPPPQQQALVPTYGRGVPPWLQKVSGGFNRMTGAMLPQTNPNLNAQQQLAAQLSGRMGMASAFLQSARPRPRGTGSILADFGDAMMAGQEASSRRSDELLREEAIRRELETADRYAKMSATLDSLIQSSALPPQTKASLSAYAQANPAEAFRALGQMGILGTTAKPELSETGEKLRDVKDVLGRDLSEREALTLAGGGALFEVDEDDDEADKPLSATDLARVRQADGSPFPFGTTAAEAQAAGARVFSEAELKQERDVSSALNTLSTLEEMAVGPDGVFKDEGGSVLTNNVLSRLGSGIVNGLGSLLGTDASIRRSVFNDTSMGAIGSLVRSMGEAGSLSDGDVARALSLIPQLGSTPDTEAKAKANLAELRKIISRGVDKFGGNAASSGRVDLGGGVSLQFLD